MKEISSKVFICGLARSGTTLLLNSLYNSDQFASLTYADVPFLLSPNIWSRISSKMLWLGAKKKISIMQRYHGDGMVIGTHSPEAFEEVFWRTFEQQEALERLDTYINLVCKKYGKQRYLSKNNQNVKRLDAIIKTCPEAKILICYRKPVVQALSLLRQHKHFTDLANQDAFVKEYLDLVGHSEFGPTYKPLKTNNLKYQDAFTLNHWLEQWIYCYSELINHSVINLPQVHLICYDQFRPNSKTLLNLEKELDVKLTLKREEKSYNEPVVDIDMDLEKAAFNLYDQMSQYCPE